VQTKTPDEIIMKIHTDAVTALTHPSVKERYEAIGAPVTPSTPRTCPAACVRDG
jgi:hypothetical protein